MCWYNIFPCPYLNNILQSRLWFLHQHTHRINNFENPIKNVILFYFYTAKMSSKKDLQQQIIPVESCIFWTSIPFLHSPLCQFISNIINLSLFIKKWKFSGKPKILSFVILTLFYWSLTIAGNKQHILHCKLCYPSNDLPTLPKIIKQYRILYDLVSVNSMMMN